MERNEEPSRMTAFVCAHCAGAEPAIPEFDWPDNVQQVLVPCTGRLQPEHVLRAFETGSSIVSVVACSEDNCHHVQGSRRCALRLDHIRSILNEIGLGENRLMLFHLPGSAEERLAVSNARAAAFGACDLSGNPAEIKAQAMHALGVLSRSPLADSPESECAGYSMVEDDEDE